MIKCLNRKYERLAKVTAREEEKRIETETKKTNRRKYR